MEMAEVKPFKFGEPLTDNAEGNPEPSSSENSEQACVETRRRVCLKCGNVITNPRKGLKFCTDKCRSAYAAYKWCLLHNRFEKPGVGSGGNQEANKNVQYKNGIGLYHKRAFSNKPHICERCGSTNNLMTHHRNEDRTNNELYNLEILCARCHRVHHNVRDSKGRFTQRDSPSLQEIIGTTR